MKDEKEKKSKVKENSSEHSAQASEKKETNTQTSSEEKLTLQEFKEKICPECEQLKEKEEKVLRTLAEAENLKKRLQREKEEFCKFATSAFLEELLPVLDNLELALTHSQNQKECAGLHQGVEMTLKIFRDILQKHGLVPVGEVGEKFDPSIHEAMAQEEREDMEEGCVAQMYQRGYKLHERLLRPAKVIVSKKCAPKEEKTE